MRDSYNVIPCACLSPSCALVFVFYPDFELNQGYFALAIKPKSLWQRLKLLIKPYSFEHEVVLDEDGARSMQIVLDAFLHDVERARINPNKRD